MPEQFLHLEAQEQQDIFTTLASELGRKANVLEKMFGFVGFWEKATLIHAESNR